MRSLFLFFVVIFLSGCGSSSNNNGESNSNSIKILSVVPSIVEEGVATTFTVTVDYLFANFSRGNIFVGFNTDSTSSYEIKLKQEVDQSQAVRTFVIGQIRPVYRSGASFVVYANINDHFGDGGFSPLANDVLNITVNPNSALRTRYLLKSTCGNQYCQ